MSVAIIVTSQEHTLIAVGPPLVTIQDVYQAEFVLLHVQIAEVIHLNILNNNHIKVVNVVLLYRRILHFQVDVYIRNIMKLVAF